MRAISFRGERINNGEWIYGSIYSYGEHTWILPIDSQRAGMTGYSYLGADPLEVYGAKTVDPKTVGQFTGLRDKNGKEIYEGDVVEVSGISPIHHKPFKHTAVIEYSMGGFYPISTFSMNGFDEQNVEVIGNIYENPELLKREE